MFQKLIFSFVALILLSSCSFKVDAPIAPGLQKVTADGNHAGSPQNQDPAVAASKKLLDKSIAEKNSNTKLFIFNLNSTITISTAIGSNFCAQIVRFSDNSLAVDLSNIVCPSEGTLLPADKIKYTALFYEIKKDTEYQMTSANTGKVIAHINADWSFPMAIMDAFCSGAIESNCKLTLTTDGFSDIRD